MTRWEYMVTEGWPGPYDLNRLGFQGWELVSVVAVGDSVRVYFKRTFVADLDKIDA